MRSRNFRERLIVAILKDGEAGIAVVGVCRRHGVRAAIGWEWRITYAGVSVRDITRMRELEVETGNLEWMYAAPALENNSRKDVAWQGAETFLSYRLGSRARPQRSGRARAGPVRGESIQVGSTRHVPVNSADPRSGLANAPCCIGERCLIKMRLGTSVRRGRAFNRRTVHL